MIVTYAFGCATRYFDFCNIASHHLNRAVQNIHGIAVLAVEMPLIHGESLLAGLSVGRL
jgi:hypothetical protein